MTLILGAVLTLAGCASYGPVYWDQRGVDPVQFARDDDRCRALATISSGPSPATQSLAYGGGPAIDRDAYIACMRDAGYREASQ